jgi:hypothetical protein
MIGIQPAVLLNAKGRKERERNEETNLRLLCDFGSFSG